MDSEMARSMNLAEVGMLSILEAFDEGVIITDEVGRVVFYNKSQTLIDDLEPEYVMGKKVTEIYNLDENSSMIMRCLNEGRPIKGEIFFYYTCRGKLANTIHSVFPLLINGQIMGVICFVKDYKFLERTIKSATRPDHRENQDLGNGTHYLFTDIVGTDRSFLDAVKLARLAADSPSPIMLLGETGTGKEMFAQSIHNASSRRGKRFIGINCAAIPENLLEGLLFGTAKGAFTGAVDKKGFFEQAHQSTLLLDEVDSMPLTLQAKLLRVLQERRVRKVGGADEIPIDVKILSSVSSDPHRAIEDGKLRMDLYHRLAVVFVQIPPLRSLKGGIEALTKHFINKFNMMLGKNIVGVTPEVMDFFLSYPWPGNIRELEHIIEGAINIIEQEDRIDIRHLPRHFFWHKIEKTHEKNYETTDLTVSPKVRMWPSKEELDKPKKQDSSNQDERLLQKFQHESERRMIQEALVEAAGNIARAARRLGLSRQLLSYKLKRHGLKNN
ncbi:MAG: sigma 54-interacting transcriptional regulator [Deltaproteobacteria bacterium]|nr:sigma 54-interacting transcriptional regulator [Deltaproteobacteria bacterium]